MAFSVDFFRHGGEVVRAARELNLAVEQILDFSASINPLGMPEGVLRAAQGSLAEAVHYPEADAASLAEALSSFHGLPPGHILPGSGSTDLLYLFPRVLLPRRAVLVTPAFSEYERSLTLAGTSVDFFPLRPGEGFRFEVRRLLEGLSPETDLVMAANPANPTGAGIDPEAIETLALALREQALVAVDEAFIDFCPGLSVIGRVPRHSNLYVFRSLTKFYAIPGLRAGYVAGPARGIARLAQAHPPWSLSTPALAAAKACLKEEDFRARTAEILPRLREELVSGLKALGFTVFPSAANYLLVRLEEKRMTVSELVSSLRNRGILIRDCANFPSLEGPFFRVAVRSGLENGRLLTALSEILG